MMENSPKAVVAAIHGTALGGGLEVALTAHYRVAVPSAKCGLPEVNLGLLPGAGGTQRLPRIVGAEKALEVMTSGSHVPAKECLAMGLVDAMAEEGKLLEGAVAFARKVLDEKMPLKKVRDRDVVGGSPEVFAAFRKANARKFRGFDAPEANIKCVEASLLPFEEGLKVERTLFMGLMTGAQSAAQRYVFFAERLANKIPDVPDDTAEIPVKKVGIIGAGTMGGGIAMNFLNVGIPVTIVETKQEALDRGLSSSARTTRTPRKRGRLTMEQVEQRMGLLTGTLELEALADSDPGDRGHLREHGRQEGGLRQARRHRQAGRDPRHQHLGPRHRRDRHRGEASGAVIGLHFFSPANVMRLLEVVRADHTLQGSSPPR
jgi:3-hydroxyacyl-CoA dehydrogenase